MESPTRLLPSPSKALNPVSPERMNQQTIPASPSLPADLLTLHHKNYRGVSEVQAKVAFLNGLSRGGSPANGSGNNAAVLRANLGREEAESALATAQEDLAEAQDRERRISERLESLLEELHGTKERQGHERSIFEKEIRKARKEAFRAASTLVKLQEELKHAKSEAKALKDEVAAERESKNKAKQEAFERAYALAGLTEELEVLKEKFRALETENHSSTLEVRAHEIRREDFGRLSLAEGDLAFLNTPRRPKRAAAGSIRSPAPEREEDIAEATPPSAHDCRSPPTPEVAPVKVDEGLLDEMKEELVFERRRRVAAEEMVHFLNIECQFERCSCRIAESQGRRYIYDADYYNTFQKPQIEAEEKERAHQASIQQAIEKDPSPQPASTSEASPLPPTPPAHRSPIHKSPVHRSPVQQTTTPRVATPQRSHHEEPEASRTPSAAPPVPVHENLPRAVKAELIDAPKIEMPVEPLVTFSPETGTFMTFPSPLRDNVRPLRLVQFDTPNLPEPQPDFLVSHRDASASPDQHVQSFTPSGDPVLVQEPVEEPVEEPVQERIVAHAPAPTVRSRPNPTDGASDQSARARLSQEARPPSRVGRDAHGYRQPLHAPKRDPQGYQPIKSTKRVPLRNDAQSQRTSHPGVPDTPIDREQALAQIRARRGRAHSKQRSASANEAGRAAHASAGLSATTARGPRRVPNPNLRPDSRSENDLGERRDLSAPVRMFRR
ncbi:uncharacterized protein N7529_004253 [Penicillium soppii]|uniref:uncharacterized protein n=1 Tax=Penicillium soppii TaxID=69789 RepID=UPI0025491888|nr:uncharacterized protein N7529_004253 [Penicillium soppii]KAJ5871900.1 hypothetical protein N7529_004253 [Penicillium soppii]